MAETKTTDLNPNNNLALYPDEWKKFKADLNNAGYIWKQFAGSKDDESIMIYPREDNISSPTARWGHHLSHISLYATLGKHKNKDSLFIRWGQATLRLSTVYHYDDKNKYYSHRPLLGPPVEGSHLKDTITDTDIKQICQSYISDPNVPSKDKELYADMIKPEAAQRAAFATEWEELLNMVEEKINEVLFADWSLRKPPTTK